MTSHSLGQYGQKTDKSQDIQQIVTFLQLLTSCLVSIMISINTSTLMLSYEMYWNAEKGGWNNYESVWSGLVQ